MKKRNKHNKHHGNQLITALIIFFTITTILICLDGNKEYTYAAASENGAMHYEYLTVAKCPITSVDVDNKTVFVEYHGKEYGYYATGKIDVTGECIVTFNSSMEIVDVK